MNGNILMNLVIINHLASIHESNDIEQAIGLKVKVSQ